MKKKHTQPLRTFCLFANICLARAYCYYFPFIILIYWVKVRDLLLASNSRPSSINRNTHLLSKWVSMSCIRRSCLFKIIATIMGSRLKHLYGYINHLSKSGSICSFCYNYIAPPKTKYQFRIPIGALVVDFASIPRLPNGYYYPGGDTVKPH